MQWHIQFDEHIFLYLFQTYFHLINLALFINSKLIIFLLHLDSTTLVCTGCFHLQTNGQDEPHFDVIGIDVFLFNKLTTN